MPTEIGKKARNGAEEYDRHPSRRLPAERSESSTPTGHEWGESDQRHRLGDDQVRQQPATYDVETRHQHGEAYADDRTDHQAEQRQTERVPNGGEDDAPDLPARCPTFGVEEPSPHVPNVRHRVGTRLRQDLPAEHVTAGLRPDPLVELPGRRHDGEGDEEQDRLAHAGDQVLARTCSARAGITCSPYACSVASLASCWR